MNNNCGIYTITNLKNGKIYVGYSTNLSRRYSEHLYYLKKGKHNNTHLQKAYNKYKEINFQFEILEFCEEKYLCAMEHYWCNLLNTHNTIYGYNIRPTDPNKKYARLSEATKLKIKNAHFGKKASQEVRVKMSLSKLGIKQDKEHINKRVNSRNGYKHSEETKKKIGNSNKSNNDLFIKMSKPILQCDKNGNVIKEWRAMREILDYYNYGRSQAKAIYNCCRLNRGTSYNYIWKYKESEVIQYNECESF